MRYQKDHTNEVLMQRKITIAGENDFELDSRTISVSERVVFLKNLCFLFLLFLLWVQISEHSLSLS